MPVDARLAQRLGECLPADQIAVDLKTRRTNSQDYSWFSNVLEEDLKGHVAEIVAWPASQDELANVLAAAYDVRTPITIRGGGTGNYGQCVPLFGGLVVNTSRFKRVVELGRGYARVEAGVRFVDLDQAAYATGQEICIYPSTYLTATIAGFAAGGSMGVGSVTHGTLVDNNVLAVSMLPVIAQPAAQQVTGEGLTNIIHAYGTTGVIVEITVPLTARKRWEQAVISFASIEACHEFCMALLTNPEIDKRLITPVEPGVVNYFKRARLGFDAGRSAALLMFGAGQREAVMALAAARGGRLDVSLAGDAKTRLTDFTWNHTTLWAKKADRGLTYLQCGFDIERFAEQRAAIRAEYGEEYAFHGEYVLNGGVPFLASLPIVPFKGREYLDRMVEFLESLGVMVANPHRYVLEQGSAVDNVQELVETKRRVDPGGLLNPGKLAAWADLGGVTSFKRASLSLARSRRRQSA